MSGVWGIRKAIAAIARCKRGNVLTTFGLALIPISMAVGAAVDYSGGATIKTAMQNAADASALYTVAQAGSLQPSELTAKAKTAFSASFQRSQVRDLAVQAVYSADTQSVAVSVSGTVPTHFMGLVGVHTLKVSVNSVATAGKRVWPVCVLVTDLSNNHTLLTKGASKIVFTDCMVQVNTRNWDAVEARDTSSIQSTNGENCFVGDIHYGNITPPKSPTCTFLDDPYDSLSVSTPATCDYTNFNTSTGGTTLRPGVYCGGILINKSATLQPGVYYVKDGKFQITGASVNVNAVGTTFLLSGRNAYLDFNSTGTITMSPASAADAGQFSGFQFYFDDPDLTSGKKKGNKPGATSTISSAKMTTSGVIYLQGQKLVIDNGAAVTINPGTVIADYILPDSNATLNMRGSMGASTSAEIKMRKTGQAVVTPRIIR